MGSSFCWIRKIVRFYVDNVTYVENVFAVKKPDQFPGFSIRIIPSATSLFNVAKLSMSRNNVRSVTAGNAVCFKNVEFYFINIYTEASIY